MDAAQILLTDLKIRLGYNESIILSRDEFNLLVDGDIGVQKELEEQIEDLESELEGAIDNSDSFQCLAEELKEKVEELREEIKELKKGNAND